MRKDIEIVTLCFQCRCEGTHPFICIVGRLALYCVQQDQLVKCSGGSYPGMCQHCTLRQFSSEERNVLEFKIIGFCFCCAVLVGKFGIQNPNNCQATNIRVHSKRALGFYSHLTQALNLRNSMRTGDQQLLAASQCSLRWGPLASPPIGCGCGTHLLLPEMDGA